MVLAPPCIPRCDEQKNALRVVRLHWRGAAVRETRLQLTAQRRANSPVFRDFAGPAVRLAEWNFAHFAEAEEKRDGDRAR